MVELVAFRESVTVRLKTYSPGVRSFRRRMLELRGRRFL